MPLSLPPPPPAPSPLLSFALSLSRALSLSLSLSRARTLSLCLSLSLTHYLCVCVCVPCDTARQTERHRRAQMTERDRERHLKEEDIKERLHVRGALLASQAIKRGTHVLLQERQRQVRRDHFPRHAHWVQHDEACVCVCACALANMRLVEGCLTCAHRRVRVCARMCAPCEQCTLSKLSMSHLSIGAREWGTARAWGRRC